uniref:Uncharacterized protein n=1 Tax=Desertifilum tharense IPPAS B-1220 TaxID=1781255 RepID=A0ACD5GNJ0_9CYAN
MGVGEEGSWELGVGGWGKKGVGSWGLGKKGVGSWELGVGGRRELGVRSWARILVNRLLFQISTQNSALFTQH